MKKLYFFLLLSFVLTSCSNDATNENTTNTLLQRVDFYPGSTYERRWLFNDNGLLNQIIKADGTINQNFTYDSNNRLISCTYFYDNGSTETHNFTYDNNDFVTSVDGVIINYDASLDAYYTGVLNQNYRLIKINNDKLLVDGKNVYVEVENGITYESESFQMSVSYSNNNIITYSPYYEGCNTMTYDDKINPLRNATLPICRAFSFVNGSTFWINGQYNSANNVLSHDYCSEDPESSVYHYTYNTNNLPVTQTHDSFYLGTYENTTNSVKYYYQGDVIP